MTVAPDLVVAMAEKGAHGSSTKPADSAHTELPGWIS